MTAGNAANHGVSSLILGVGMSASALALMAALGLVLFMTLRYAVAIPPSCSNRRRPRGDPALDPADPGPARRLCC